MSLKMEIETRPSQEDYDEKIKQCNVLRAELMTLTGQLTNNEKLLEQLRSELDEERARYREMTDKCLSECSSQTEDEDDDVSVIENESTKVAREVPELMEALKVLSIESPSRVGGNDRDDEIDSQASTSTTDMPQKTSFVEDDDELNNHPKVLYEDELIVFKEKCSSLSEENVRLQRELSELRATFGHFQRNWLHNAALKYIVPIIIVFIAYIFLSLKS